MGHRRALCALGQTLKDRKGETNKDRKEEAAQRRGLRGTLKVQEMGRPARGSNAR